VEADKSEMPEVKILPTGYSYLTKVFGELSRVESPTKSGYIPRFFLGGQITRQDISLFPVHEFIHFGIEFKPTGIHHFFNIDMSETLNGFEDGNDLLEEQVSEELLSLIDCKSFEDSCNKLDDYFIQLLQKSSKQEKDQQIEKAVDLIIENANSISINDLAQKVFLSPRQLRRKFKEICGISPGAYRNIIQINNVYSSIAKNDEKRLSELAYHCGFYDTSHFVKTFEKLMNEKPLDFINRDDSFLQTYIKYARD
jgi:AraC-like DNA-binding protein